MRRNRICCGGRFAAGERGLDVGLLPMCWPRCRRCGSAGLPCTIVRLHTSPSPHVHQDSLAAALVPWATPVTAPSTLSWLEPSKELPCRLQENDRVLVHNVSSCAHRLPAGSLTGMMAIVQVGTAGVAKRCGGRDFGNVVMSHHAFMWDKTRPGPKFTIVGGTDLIAGQQAPIAGDLPSSLWIDTAVQAIQLVVEHCQLMQHSAASS